jgi:hypothetical protein
VEGQIEVPGKYLALHPPQIPLDLILESNEGRRGGKPATKHLSYGMATLNKLYVIPRNLSKQLQVCTMNGNAIDTLK